jgi:hypothetical protein
MSSRFWEILGINNLREVEKGALLTVERFIEGTFLEENGGFCPEILG